MYKSKIIQIAAAGLILLGFIYILGFLISTICPVAPSQAWKLLTTTSITLFIVSGLALFSFRKWARVFAIFSYFVALLEFSTAHLRNWKFLYSNYNMYHADKSTNPYNVKWFVKDLFGYSGLVCIIFAMVFIFFIVLLFRSKEQFE